MRDQRDPFVVGLPLSPFENPWATNDNLAPVTERRFAREKALLCRSTHTPSGVPLERQPVLAGLCLSGETDEVAPHAFLDVVAFGETDVPAKFLEVDAPVGRF